MISLERKPSVDRARLRWIKDSLHEVAALREDDVVTVSELTCLEEGCAPRETVFGLLRSAGPQLQHKLHKAIADVDESDLLQVCQAWGLSPRHDFQPFPKDSP